MSQSLGKHSLVEFYECNVEKLNDSLHLQNTLLVAAKKAGATIVNDFFHNFSPHGVTGVIVIAESHLSIHTWPEYGYAAVDIFTCGDLIDNLKGMETIKEGLESKHYSIVEIKRGILPSYKNIKHKADDKNG